MRKFVEAAGPTRGWTAQLTLLLLLGGCGDAPDPETGEPTAGARADAASLPDTPVSPERVFDREFLFLSASADSVVLLPWSFRTTSVAGDLHRENGAWLSRAGTWETLAQESMETPPARIPWRIVPGEKIRLVVGQNDRVESLMLRDPPRELETRVGDFLVEWSRPGAESAVLYRGETHFPSGPVEGFVLDLRRRWDSPDQAPGDWILLHSGDDLQLFMEEGAPLGDPRHPALHRAWSRIDGEHAEWRAVTLAWDELRPMERARRDIPARWTFSSPGGDVVGELSAVSSQLAVTEGERPILPVAGFFGVAGTVWIEGEAYPVVGTVRHVQP